jgi:hypothetical protein
MAETLLLCAAMLSCVCGMAWLALAMKVHWRQVRADEPPSRGSVLALRALGALALLASLAICLRVDHASMAWLVWVMSVIPAILIVAFVLAWRPHWLSWLVVWVRAQSSAETLASSSNGRTSRAPAAGPDR